MSAPIITVNDGKYTFKTASNGYSVEVLRYGDPWLIIDQGCNAVHSLMYEIERLKSTLGDVLRHATFPADNATDRDWLDDAIVEWRKAAES